MKLFHAQKLLAQTDIFVHGIHVLVYCFNQVVVYSSIYVVVIKGCSQCRVIMTHIRIEL